MNERWMKDMQDRFADFEKPAPEGLLADVQREMQRRGLVPGVEPAEKVSEPQAEQRKLIPLWVKGASVAAMVAIMAGVGALLLTDDNEGNLPGTDGQITQTPIIYMAEPQSSTEKIEATPALEQKTDAPRLLAQHRPVPSAIKDDEADKTDALPTIEENVERIVVEDTNRSQEVAGQAHQNDALGNEEAKDKEDVKGNEGIISSNERIYSRDRENPFRSQSKKKRGWEVGANIAGVQGLSNPTYKYLVYANSLSYNDQAYFNEKLTMGQVDVSGAEAPTLDAYAANAYSNAAQSLDGSVVTQATVSNYSNQFVTTRAINSSVVFANNQLNRMYVGAHHRQPVKLGVSLRYHFNNRLSVQTGLDYSYHSSELIRQIGNSQIKVDQKLHFVGVPVALSFSLWSPGRFNFYLSAGGEAEKVVKGTQSTLSLTTNVADRKDKEGVDEKPWQFSVMGSGGVQFNVTNLISLYAEPGVAYYFDNKSGLPTIYQEKPFNFNLNMGLRFNINRK